MAPKRAPARRGRRSSTPASEEEAFVPTPAEKAPLQGIREETTPSGTMEGDSAVRDSHLTEETASENAAGPAQTEPVEAPAPPMGAAAAARQAAHSASVAARQAGEAVQDTLASAARHVWTSSEATAVIAGLLLITLLAGYGVATLLQPQGSSQDVAQSNAFAHKRIDELLHLQNTTFLQLQSLQEWVASTLDDQQELATACQRASSLQAELASRLAPFSDQGEHNVIRATVKEELMLYSADRTGLPDYALASAGGTVTGHSRLMPPNRAGWTKLWSWLRGKAYLLLQAVHPHANQFLLSAGPPSPGHCLPLEGREGHVDLRLRSPIVPGALTLEHIPSSIAFSPGSAPRDLRLLALPQGVIPGTHLLSSELPVLGSFSYNGKAPGAVQTFNLSTSLEVQDVRLQVLSNHGSSYTCIYRVRVHAKGDTASSKQT